MGRGGCGGSGDDGGDITLGGSPLGHPGRSSGVAPGCHCWDLLGGGSQDYSGGVFVGFLSGGVVIVGSPRGAAVGPPQGSAPWVPVSLLPLGGHSGR